MSSHTIRFTATRTHEVGIMKRPTLLTTALAGVLVLAGCSAASKLESSFGTKYRYAYQLTAPAKGKLSYEDARIKILFKIDEGAIRFKLTNRTSTRMSVDWVNASIGVQGRYSAVRNTRHYYAQDSNITSGPPVPPKGYVIDMALPSQNVVHTKRSWQERNLLPTTDRHSPAMKNRILANKGSVVDLLLPIEFAGEGVVNYAFRFTVTSVDVLAWERYRKPRRPAPPPSTTVAKTSSDDQILTAAIVVGVLGISAILLTQKKSPPSE